MTTTIKPSQLTRVGYSYQDLFCIKFLLEWFHDPIKYQWIKVESSQSGAEESKSLDDVVAYNSDNKYELYQVKFTIDSARTDLEFSFEWLLEKRKKGTSLIQKWHKDFHKFHFENTLAVAALYTNRKPNNEVRKCLVNNKIIFEKIPQEQIAKILEQVTDCNTVKSFFDNFVFNHSQLEIDGLENYLHDQVVPDHTTEEGWLRLLHTVQFWATRHKEPKPCGEITLSHIHEIFGDGLSKSLPQSFEIPNGYQPPSEKFHNGILTNIKTGGRWVIYGKPGMGKSTYLSYLAAWLTKHNLPVIRHHYSISSQGIIDRISFVNVARSLQHQLKLAFPFLFQSREIKTEDLEIWIKEAAENCNQKKKKLTIIIDGLDHVARERSDISQLEHLVNRLLHQKDNLSLIFGTQPVSDSKLPASMAALLPREKLWMQLPAMDMSSIKNWLINLDSSYDLGFDLSNTHDQHRLTAISEAFYYVSAGYPLYLVYSLRAISQKKVVITEYDIKRLPACPEGDINNYYHALWANLTSSARQILLLVSHVDFAWPDKESIGYCFDNTLEFINCFDEIQHLFEVKRSGVSPFHSSIIVYIRNKEEFASSSIQLLTKVKKWLHSSAPRYWKWGWEWIIEANLGNIELLINGITNQWTLNSLIGGYPLNHIEHIISVAETKSLKHNRYADLVKLRLLKIRLINGPEFQIQSYADFLKVALKYSNDNYPLLWRADNLKTINSEEIPVVAVLLSETFPQIIEPAFEEIIRRINFYVKSSDSNHYGKIDSLIDAALDIACTAYDSKIEKIIWMLNRLTDKEAYFESIIKKLHSSGNGNLILEIPITLIPKKLHGFYWDNFTLACHDSGVSFLDRQELHSANAGYLVNILRALNGLPLYKVSTIKLIEKPSNETISSKFYTEFFFYNLLKQIEGKKPKKQTLNTEYKEVEIFHTYAMNFLHDTSAIVALNLKQGQINSSGIYSLINNSKLNPIVGSDWGNSAVTYQFTRAISEISFDLYRLLNISGKCYYLDVDYLTTLKNSTWWNGLDWLKVAFEKNQSNIISEVIKKEIINSSLDSIRLKRDNISNIANEVLDLTTLASQLSLREEIVATLNLAGQFILGYGHRKDTTFSELFEAVEACSEEGVGDIKSWLSDISIFTVDMFEFTEREIRHIPSIFIDLVARHYPEKLVDEFSYHLENQNWSIALNVMEKFIVHFEIISDADKALVNAQTSYQCLNLLKEKAKNHPEYLEIYQNQLTLLGGGPPLPRDNKSSSNSNSIDADKILIEVKDYPPCKINELYSALKSSNLSESDSFFIKWFDYWISIGKGMEILSSYDEMWKKEQEIPYFFRGSLSHVFSLSLKLQGARKAYIWAVRTIQLNSDWSRYTGSSSEARILEYGKIYKKDWKKFLTDTLSSSEMRLRGDEWLMVPTAQLVKFLFAVGEKNLACDVTEVMLSSFLEEIKHLNLSPSYWIGEPIKKSEISSKLLLLYSKWPDHLARLKTSSEIAMLLDNDKEFQPLYLNHLKTLSFESDIVDLLNVLKLTKRKHFSDKEISSSIQYPSILSDMILKSLDYEYTENKDFITEINIDELIDFGKFEDTKKYGIPLVYFIEIKELGDELGFDLYKYMAITWEEITKRKALHYFNPHYYGNDIYYPQDRITCSFSSDVEATVLSAYLISLNFAYKNLGLDKRRLIYLANLVIPKSDFLKDLSASSKPTGWPILSEIDDSTPIPNVKILQEYLQNIIKTNSTLIRANGPVFHEPSNLCLDLELIVIHSDLEITKNAEYIYQNLKSKNSQVNVLAIPIYDLRVIGRWEKNYMSRGYYVPSFSFFSGNSIKPKESFSEWGYWVQNWYPKSYYELGPALGTFMNISSEAWQYLLANGGSFYMLGKLTILDKRRYGSDSEPQAIHALVKIN